MIDIFTAVLISHIILHYSGYVLRVDMLHTSPQDPIMFAYLCLGYFVVMIARPGFSTFMSAWYAVVGRYLFQFAVMPLHSNRHMPCCL